MGIGGFIGHEAMSRTGWSESDFDRSADVDIALLGPNHWKLLRKARLAALRCSPHAFVGSLMDESSYPPAEWIDRLTRQTWVAAQAGGNPVGLACLTAENPEEPGVRFIQSVWVAPTYRRRGIIRRMLELLEAHATAERAELLRLWVLADNPGAIDVYRRLDFQPIHDLIQDSAKLAGNGRRVQEIPMFKPLQQGGPGGRNFGLRPGNSISEDSASPARRHEHSRSQP